MHVRKAAGNSVDSLVRGLALCDLYSLSRLPLAGALCQLLVHHLCSWSKHAAPVEVTERLPYSLLAVLVLASEEHVFLSLQRELEQVLCLCVVAQTQVVPAWLSVVLAVSLASEHWD